MDEIRNELVKLLVSNSYFAIPTQSRLMGDNSTNTTRQKISIVENYSHIY